MLGNRKKELDGDCQGTGGALIYLTLLLGMGLCPYPRVLPGGLGDQVTLAQGSAAFASLGAGPGNIPRIEFVSWVLRCHIAYFLSYSPRDLKPKV